VVPQNDDSSVRVAWQLIGLQQSGISTLETRVSVIAAGELGGLVALWTQLSSFHGGARALGWIAWAVLVLSIVLLAEMLAPRGLGRFATPVLPEDVLDPANPLDAAGERRLVAVIGASLAEHTIRVGRRLQVSVLLSIVALAFTTIAYVVEKSG
jgi:hypothetical protein